MFINRDGADEQILLELTNLARGFDVYGNRIPYDKQLEAIAQYEAIKKRMDELGMHTQKLQLLRDMESWKLDLEQQRIGLDQQRVQIEMVRADSERHDSETRRIGTIVQALQIAASAGASGEQILAAVQALADRSLPREALTAIPEVQRLAITKKD